MKMYHAIILSVCVFCTGCLHYNYGVKRADSPIPYKKWLTSKSTGRDKALRPKNNCVLMMLAMRIIFMYYYKAVNLF